MNDPELEKMSIKELLSSLEDQSELSADALASGAYRKSEEHKSIRVKIRAALDQKIAALEGQRLELKTFKSPLHAIETEEVNGWTEYTLTLIDAEHYGVIEATTNDENQLADLRAIFKLLERASQRQEGGGG